MNLETHLFKKDLRRARPLLAIWVLLLLLGAVLVSASVNPADRVLQMLFMAINQITPFLELLFLAVFVPFIIQEEPLVGTTAFWLSRPLSRLQLLRSKLLFALAIFLLPPFVVEVAVLVANGIAARDIALAVPQILGQHLAWLLPLLVIAALTPSLGRYAIVTVSLFVALILTELAVEMTQAFLHPVYFSLNLGERSLQTSAGVVCAVLSLLLGAGVLAHQYLTRRTARSVLAAGLSLLLLLLTQCLWSWDFLASRPSNTTPPFDLSKVELQLATLHANEYSFGRGTAEPDRMLNGEVDAYGVPHDYVLQARKIEARLAPPGGPALPVKEIGQGALVTSVDALESVVGEPIVNFRSQFNYNLSFFALNAETYGHNVGRPLEFTANLELVASKYVLTATLPVTVGSRYDHGSEHLAITNLLRNELGIDLLMRERHAHLLFTPSTLISYDPTPTLYVLRNRKLHEAVLQKRNDTDFVFDRQTSSVLVNKGDKVSFGSERNQAEMAPDLTPEWLADAELLRLELKPLGSFKTALRPETINLTGSYSIKWRTTHPGPDRARLEKIKLPDHATKAQVRDYIRAIQIASQAQRAFSSLSDPQAAMLRKVGPENLDVLIDARAGQLPSFNDYLDQAIKDLAGPANKEVILESLPAEPQLADIVLKKGWQADVRELLTKKLSLHRSDLTPSWVKAVATFQDPSTYADLIWYFENTWDRSGIFDAIRNLPGIQLRDVVARAWTKARVRPTSAVEMLFIAGEYGHVNTLDTAIDVLGQKEESNHQYWTGQIAAFLRKFTPAPGDLDSMVAWIKAHRAQLIFDPETKKFVLKG